MLWVVLWHVFISPSPQQNLWFVLVLWFVPLLLPLRGILAGTAYTHAWACYILLWYVLHSATIIGNNDHELWLAIVELSIALVSFTACLYFAKTRGRELGLGLKKLKDEK
ncbi:DUF2069 domain-containing protein [Alginatibacterium sediminis]|uniref:DUF2069 domain-containing protein n=2 Tax=Alginatibacterium sediminis TaxID=2164068 RepID=A0A420EBV7_9ALTE|nr:DUF2069 domain-containing protein [Alginatibacterium sediminis]